MRLRKFIFWLHLAAGVVAGSVIFMMSVTGVLLAFERQIVAFAERHTRTVQPPTPDGPRLGLDTLVSKARESLPEGLPTIAVFIRAYGLCNGQVPILLRSQGRSRTSNRKPL
jgi:uncharacterized iron-regulated membrane protein